MAEYTGESLSAEEWQKKFGVAPSGAEPTVPRPSGTETVKQMVEAATSPTTMFGMSPAEIAGIVTGAVIAGYGAKKGISAIKQRSILKSPETIVTEADEAKPFVDVESREISKATQPDYTKPAYQRAGQASPFDVQPAPPVNPAVEKLKQQSQTIKSAIQAQQPNVQTPVQTAGQPAAQTQMGAVNPPQTPTSVTEAIETGQSPAKSIQIDVAKQLDKATQETNKLTPDVAKQTALSSVVRDAQGNFQWPEGMSPAARAGAEAFAKQYPDVAAKLEKQGQFGILGFGSGDNNLYNTYGAEGRKAVLEYFHGGKPLGPYEPNYETLMKTVRQGVPAGDVSGLMSRLPAEAEAGNFGQLGTPASFGGKKGGLVKGAGQVSAALKAGGPALLLMSMADLAKAKTQEEKMNAGLGILGAILPPGLDIFPAGEGSTISEKERARQEEFAMLGSPYYQTQQAKNLRQAKKVGAGRGIAPPSQYQR